MDESFGILCLSISLELLFHVESSTTPNDVWTTLEGLFKNKYEMHGHILENELISLNPSNYENLQDFFTRFKALLLQLKGCRIDKSMQGDQLILSILSKLGPEYSGLCLYISHCKAYIGCNMENASTGCIHRIPHT
jgi:hypothetical protein